MSEAITTNEALRRSAFLLRDSILDVELMSNTDLENFWKLCAFVENEINLLRTRMQNA